MVNALSTSVNSVCHMSNWSIQCVVFRQEVVELAEIFNSRTCRSGVKRGMVEVRIGHYHNKQ